MPYYDSWADDRDERIQYGGGWDRVDFPGAWDNSAYSTRVNGATARFRFFGRRVAVILAIPVGDGQPVTGTFRVDGGPVVSRSVATTWTAAWNQAVFDSGPLTWGEHSIEIINTGTAMSFRLDRIDFDTTGGPTTSTTSTTSQTQTTTSAPAPTDTTPRITTSDSSSTGTRPDSTNTALVVQTQTQTVNGTVVTLTGTSAASSPTTGDRNVGNDTTSTLGERKGPPITAIVSSALAVILLIIILLGIRFWMKSRRARKRAKTIATPLSPSSFTQVPWGGFSDRTSYSPSTRPLRYPASSSGTRSDYSAPDSDTSASSQLSPLRHGASAAQLSKERELRVVGEETPRATDRAGPSSQPAQQEPYYDMPPPAYPGLGPPPTPGPASGGPSTSASS